MVRDTQIWELLGSIYFNVLKTDKQKTKKETKTNKTHLNKNNQTKHPLKNLISS